MGTLAWHRAATLLGLFSGFAAVSRDGGISSTLPQVPDDWPDAFRVDQLATLQRPGKDESQERAAIERALEADIAAGRLVPAGIERVCTFASIESELSAGMDGRPYRRRTELYRTVPTLTREAFAGWLRAQGEVPSEHVRAWLGEPPPDLRARRAHYAQQSNAEQEQDRKQKRRQMETLADEALQLRADGAAHSDRHAAKTIARRHGVSWWESIRKEMRRRREGGAGSRK